MSAAIPVWPVPQAGLALLALARASRLPLREAPLPVFPAGFEAQPERWAAWLAATAEGLDLELEAVNAPYPELGDLLLRAGPGLLHLPGKGLAVLLSGGRGRVVLLGPDLRRHTMPLETLRAALAADLEGLMAARVAAVLDKAGVSGAARDRCRAALYRQMLRSRFVDGCWILRLPPSAPFWLQIRGARLHRAIGLLLVSHGMEYGLYVLAWWAVGQGALQGRLDRGWLLAWALLLLTLVPFRMLTTWAQGRMAVGVGGLLKWRMLVGALRLSPEEVRHEGVGQFLGRVIESEAVESLALSGGLMSAIALLELCMAALVLAEGAGGLLHVGALVLWLGLSVGVALAYLRRRTRWTGVRLQLTQDLVERMVGHRTRLAQQAPERWHLGEDEALDRYLVHSEAMDRTAALLSALLPRGWMMLGLLGLFPAFVWGDASSGSLAVGVGGVFLALGALQSLSTGLVSMGGAWIAWRSVAPLFHSAAREQAHGVPGLALSAEGAPVIEAHDLRFRYQARGRPVLDGCTLRIQAGDRILLQGPSGGGKSTLASVLVGLRSAQSGLLLLGGLDPPTLGARGWRQRVVAAPQFHENHVLTGTFAFNLLMGRRWPALPQDLAEAEDLCLALGLGPLLERMPSGLLQMVGETGWQLSHGERSRLFLARALLQGAELVVLDESFAALDPENLAKALLTTLERAPSLIVIAHP